MRQRQMLLVRTVYFEALHNTGLATACPTLSYIIVDVQHVGCHAAPKHPSETLCSHVQSLDWQARWQTCSSSPL